jgi:hypothetical protein
MIQAIMLIALGFLSASLIGVLVAPSLWSRAYRLSRKRLEQTLPASLSEIEAAQDQLRASYAVRMRRLETALASAKQKAAMQLVDNSRLQMQIVALKDEVADLDLKLSERRNAATVLEQTITKRFPELDREITAVKGQLEERSFDLQDLTNKLSRRSEELTAAERAAASYQDEVGRLQQALEKNSGDRSGRRFRRASQWSLDDYRAEYDRLNLELSRLRQQLSQLQDRDAQQANIIREELQKLAELILVSALPKPGARAEEKQAGAAKRTAGLEPRRDRPVPWTESAAPATALQETKVNAERAADAAETGAASEPGPATAAQPAAPAVAAEPAQKPAPASGVSQAQAQSQRSKLLHGVVQAPAGAANANGSAEAQPANAAGQDTAAAGAASPQEADAAKPAPEASARTTSPQSRTLLEMLRGAGETLEADQ